MQPTDHPLDKHYLSHYAVNQYIMQSILMIEPHTL